MQRFAVPAAVVAALYTMVYNMVYNIVYGIYHIVYIIIYIIGTPALPAGQDPAAARARAPDSEPWDELPLPH